ncbi:MAG: stage II sporulation protein M [Candidatus Nanoarchaeia archaeon]
MVLDWLINVHNLEKKPYKMLFFGLIYSLIAAVLAIIIFPREASAVALALTIAAFLPILLNVVKEEELKDEHSKISLLKHWPALKFFVFMFIGMVLTYIILAFALPQNYVNSLFDMQIRTLVGRGVELGAVISIKNSFLAILLNNFKVLAVGILLAFIFGAGAIFILEWNASVLGVLIGGLLRHSFDISSLKYLIHGIPEITAYFIGGLGSAIISMALARYKYNEAKFSQVLWDAFSLILLSIIVLIIAAILEVTVSPLF